MRLISATLLAAVAAAAAIDAAQIIYRKLLLRSVPIYDSSHRSLSAAAGLPAELSASKNVAELTCESAASGGGVCHVYLIGTLHRTQRFRDQVRALIEFLKPEVVFLELCPFGAHLLMPQNASRGGEFYVAYEEAKKYGGKVIFGDRIIEITLRRCRIMRHLWECFLAPCRLSLFKIINIVKKYFFEKDEFGAFLLINGEMARLLPSCYETFINERDQYMSAKLLQAARQHNSVVAVVGFGHLQGIQKHWEQPVDMKELLQAPTRSRRVTSIRRIICRVLL